MDGDFNKPHKYSASRSMERRNIVLYAMTVLMISSLILSSLYHGKRMAKNEELIQQSYEDISILKRQKAELISEIEFLDSTLRVFDFKYSMVYIRPNDPGIQSLATSLEGPEAAYYFVRDEVAYDAMSVNYMASAVLQTGKGDCTGKANLLASLLRAEGVSENDVHVVLGTITHGEEPYTHAWVEFYNDNKWRVLDSSAYPSVYSFEEWDRESFYEHFGAVNWIEYNDKYSTIVEKVDSSEP